MQLDALVNSLNHPDSSVRLNALRVDAAPGQS